MHLYERQAPKHGRKQPETQYYMSTATRARAHNTIRSLFVEAELHSGPNVCVL
jgi:hypothetical protein